MRILGEIVWVWTVCLCASANAGTVTIATFEDPAPSSLTPLFFFDAPANQLNGGWSFTGLTLNTIAGDFQDVTFAMAALPGPGPGLVGAGTIEFSDTDDQAIFTMDFDSAVLTIDTFGATEFKALNDVTFTGSILPLPTEAESFAFGFANQTAVGPDGSYTATAAFTSSARLIPEPPPLLLLYFAMTSTRRAMRRMGRAHRLI